ncbi:hypothetical protein ERJ75_001003100 [Trypanosoma vivax]|uniref:Uncharacterized protein n=1 Tax=Trypanosoma vivax (strain Y486) TaxID=1055687 RepID=G0UB00_TRYVY|nr:hypothetical protein TRVL_02550 [Trypanosoma vivax]KAH8611673.1 hypothetical protein ERJ75_001003100 [Trypanosoma vivax]CCC52987.1 conserved hypothetical protein [Trypanosoma vivax Y486]
MQLNQLYVDGLAGLLSPAGIRTYRQAGVVVARNLLPESMVEALVTACRLVALSRGPRLFPGIDDAHSGRIEFDARMTPKPTADLQSQPLPQELQQRLKQQDEARALERRYQKILLKCRNEKQVERVYARLLAQRERYMKFKKVKSFNELEEESAGLASDRRMREIGQSYEYDDVKRSFEAYRSSGKMEMEVRRDHHIDRALEHLQNWSKCWCRVWPDSPELQELVLRGEVGSVIGEAAAALAGEIVIRLFDDAVHDYHNFLNSTPFHFVGNSTNFRNVNGMTVSVGMASHDDVRMFVIPGSHHVMRQFTSDGRDFSSFRVSGVFDTGGAIRSIKPLRQLPVIQLLPLEAGSVLFLNHYTLAAAQPTMCGAAANYLPPTGTPIKSIYQYSMTLMPDRCVFDGLRNSWASRDSHGPLYTYKPGQLLNDDALFPVLHRALDVQ